MAVFKASRKTKNKIKDLEDSYKEISGTKSRSYRVYRAVKPVIIE